MSVLNSECKVWSAELSPEVQPIYEHIAVADYYQLARIEQIVIPRADVDEAERRLLYKAVYLRRKDLIAAKEHKGPEENKSLSSLRSFAAIPGGAA